MKCIWIVIILVQILIIQTGFSQERNLVHQENQECQRYGKHGCSLNFLLDEYLKYLPDSSSPFILSLDFQKPTAFFIRYYTAYYGFPYIKETTAKNLESYDWSYTSISRGDSSFYFFSYKPSGFLRFAVSPDPYSINELKIGKKVYYANEENLVELVSMYTITQNHMPPYSARRLFIHGIPTTMPVIPKLSKHPSYDWTSLYQESIGVRQSITTERNSKKIKHMEFYAVFEDNKLVVNKILYGKEIIELNKCAWFRDFSMSIRTKEPLNVDIQVFTLE